MKLLCVQRGLSRQFLFLGRLVARYPVYFVLGPILMTAILSTGTYKMRSNRDVDYLFTAVGGRAHSSKKFIENMFPMNFSSYYDLSRITQKSYFTMVQVMTKDKGNILHNKYMKEIILLDKIIKNITVISSGKINNYTTLCGRQFNKCFESNALELAPHLRDIRTGRYKIKYPVYIDLSTGNYKEYIMSLGGVTLDDNEYVKEVKALRLVYALDIKDPVKAEAIKIWQELFLDKMNSVKFRKIDVSFLNDASIESELQRCTDRLLPRIPIVVGIVALFSFLTCMTNDWIKCKPWLGPSACISAGLALASGCGLMFYLGIEYVDFNIALCYIILGTEIDDAFVLIAAWRVTNPKDSVEKRMGETYSEAGVSITITSITNFISFCIGMITPFPAFRTFCFYGATWFLFTYVYQITFFGGCMALSGYREKNGIHPFTFRIIKGKEVKDTDTTKSKTEDSDNEDYVMSLFRDTIGEWLTKKSVKIVVTMLFFLNLIISLLGLMYMKIGNDYGDVFRKSSSLVNFNNVMYKYFGSYTYPVHIVINETLNYADVEVQKSLEETLQKFEAHPHIGESEYRISWLKYFKVFAEHPAMKLMMTGYNMSKKKDFLDSLHDVFLRFPQAKQFNQDVIFDKNRTDIIASRFLIPLKDITGTNTEINLLSDLYDIVDKSPFNIRIHSLMFHMLEQALLIKNILCQLAVVSAALICIIFFIFVPNLTCALCTSVVIFCIICETVGYVSFMNVKLDIVMLACLVVCIGFSINYPTHISYSFIIRKGLTSNAKLKKSLYDIGLPIFQGSVTTVLGVSILPFEPYYSSVSFFKVVVIIVLETAFHAMFVIPVFLSILNNCDKPVVKNEFDYPPEEPLSEERFSLTGEKELQSNKIDAD